jgi:hypothetical protein
MDPLVAADERQQGNGSTGKPSWQWHGRSRVTYVVRRNGYGASGLRVVGQFKYADC